MTEADVYPFFPRWRAAGSTRTWCRLTRRANRQSLPLGGIFPLTEVSADVLCGPAEKTASLQVDVYASSIDEARLIREEVRIALEPLGYSDMNDTNGYEPDTALYRAMLDVRIIN